MVLMMLRYSLALQKSCLLSIQTLSLLKMAIHLAFPISLTEPRSTIAAISLSLVGSHPEQQLLESQSKMEQHISLTAGCITVLHQHSSLAGCISTSTTHLSLTRQAWRGFVKSPEYAECHFIRLHALQLDAA